MPFIPRIYDYAVVGLASLNMLILPREWLEEVEIEVKVLAKEPEAGVKPKEEPKVAAEEDLSDKFLEWVRDKALDLVAVDAFIVDKDAYLLTAEAARRFSQELGRKVSLKELAKILSNNYSGVGIRVYGGKAKPYGYSRYLETYLKLNKPFTFPSLDLENKLH